MIDTRRTLAAGLALLLAGGCDQIIRTLGLTDRVEAPLPEPIGPERLRVTLLASGVQATLAPVAQSGDVTVWQTLDGITLSFRQGVLIGTRGLGDDLMSADVAGTIAMLRRPDDRRYYPQIRSYLDGEGRTVFHSFQCRRAEQTGTVSGTDGQAPDARRIEERCVSPRHEMNNIYWLDDAGAVIKSHQWVSTTIQDMETEIVTR